MSVHRFRGGFQRVRHTVQDYARLLALIILLVCMRIGLRLLGYRRFSRLLLRLSPQPNPQGNVQVVGRARRLARTLNIASTRGVIRATCLERSMLLWWLLRWFDITSDIQFGIRRSDDGIGAHAWVEHYGAVINDRLDIATLYPVLLNDMAPDRIGELL